MINPALKEQFQYIRDGFVPPSIWVMVLAAISVAVIGTCAFFIIIIFVCQFFQCVEVAFGG